MFFGVFVDTSKSLIYKLLLIIWLIFRWYDTLCGILEFNFDAHNTGGSSVYDVLHLHRFTVKSPQTFISIY